MHSLLESSSQCRVIILDADATICLWCIEAISLVVQAVDHRSQYTSHPESPL